MNINHENPELFFFFLPDCQGKRKSSYYLQLKKSIETELRQKGLQVTPFTITKVIQLYETKNSRHSSMLVGKTGSGKTVTWRTLQSALTALHHMGAPGFQAVQVSS